MVEIKPGKPARLEKKMLGNRSFFSVVKDGTYYFTALF